MPQSEGKTVCFEYHGLITLEHYNAFFRQIETVMSAYGTFNMLQYYGEDFTGWSPEAADANVKNILEFGGRTDRLAYISPPKKKVLLHKMAPQLFGGQMRYFEPAQLEEALAWVKQD